MTYPEVVEFLNTNQDLNLPTKESVEFVIKLAQARLAKIASKNKN